MNENQSSSFDIDPSLILNYTLDQFLDYVGNQLVIDVVYTYVSSVVGFMGTLTNLFSLWIFFGKEFDNQQIYVYYRILSLNACLHDFMGTIYSVCFSPRYIPLSYQPACVDYQNVYVPIHAFFFFHSAMIEIGILLDLLKVFNQKLNECFLLRAKYFSMILLLVSILFGLTTCLVYVPSSLTWYNYDASNMTYIKHQMYFLGPSEFSLTYYGTIYVAVYSFLTTIPLLSTHIILNTFLLVQIRKHFIRSETFINRPAHNANELVQIEQLKQKKRAQRRAFKMAFTICTISIISRTVLMLGLIFYNANGGFVGIILLAFADLFILTDSFSSIFVFYNCNLVFKRKFLKFFRLLKD